MEIGTIVKSKSGRDKNRYYIVLSIQNDRMVSVVDGDIRKLEKPKTKNIKHLQKISNSVVLKEKIENKKQIFDKEINKAINTCIQSLLK